MALKYKRILLKLSGEALAGDQKFGLDYDTVYRICASVKKCVELGAEIAIVVGGGNFWRGRSSGQMDRTRADHMGMLATVINALALGRRPGGPKGGCAGADRHRHAADRRALHKEPGGPPSGKGQSGYLWLRHRQPLFSTDTTSSLRAAEIDADIIFKATLVDGVYDSDPNQEPRCSPVRPAFFQRNPQ